jgi:hypothetical protein
VRVALLSLPVCALVACSSYNAPLGEGTPEGGSDATAADARTEAMADATGPAEAGPFLAQGSGAVCTGAFAAGDSATTITIDGTSTGRTFDFIGGLSGGGGTSRLLYDYPSEQQGEILDYLFKFGYGASLQLLKVEIGADTDTTNGAEASHERTPTDENYHRGYEWWLMQQAKARNPDIKLYGLEWGAPGWFSGGFFSQDNINYILHWIQNAKSVYGLTIDYVGGWNENGYDKSWFESLKAALVANGLTTQVVAADAFGDWTVATDMNSDPAFNAAVDVVGVHYPCGYLSSGVDCGSGSNLADALSNGKPLWASEEGSLPFDDGAFAMARTYNRHYIQAKVTASVNWSLVGSWYSDLPYGGVDGLLFANQPWSGFYAVDREIWATAHTTQFVQPGWQYLDSGSALVAGVGSHVALKSTNNKDWSLIVETMDTGAPHTFQVEETGGVFAGPVHVWATDLASLSPSQWFVRQADVAASGCGFAFTAEPNHVYTLTTTSGQGKGATRPPLPAALELPYSEDFETYSVGSMPNIPKYFSTVEGAFEVENCVGGRDGKCLEQEIATAPIPWGSAASPNPVTFVGDPGWVDYRVSVDALLQESGFVDLIGRVTGQNQKSGAVMGYHLQMADSGAWTLFAEDAMQNDTALSSGTATFGLNAWHTLALDFHGTTVDALVDGASIGAVTDTTYSAGNAAMAVSKWNNAQFDNFSVTSSGGGAGGGCSALPLPVGDAGVSLITDFSQVAADAGPGASATFGAYSLGPSGFGGGSYAYPGLGPGTDSLADAGAGIYCTTLASQNSFVATATPGTGWVLSGQVSSYSGVGLYLYQCVDASAFQGIEFTISGDVGNESTGVASPDQLTFSVSTPPDIAADSGPGDSCTLGSCGSPAYTFTVPAQPTTIRVTWDMLTGGSPVFVLNPSQISGIQWSIPWPCIPDPQPFVINITISDVAFF